MPAPHGQYKSGISYNDAITAAEIYTKLRNRRLEVKAPELLGDVRCETLILIGGKKTNPIAKEFQTLEHASLNLDLDDGVIYDKEKQVVLTPEYASGQDRTVGTLGSCRRQIACAISTDV
jgi:hypothetical protein